MVSHQLACHETSPGELNLKQAEIIEGNSYIMKGKISPPHIRYIILSSSALNTK